jgi:hypothetical protein
MTITPADVAKAAAERFRAQRERATAKHAKARSDATALRARVQRESQEKMAEAKRRKAGDEPEDRLISSPWPKAEAARYQFDSPDDGADTADAMPVDPAPRPEPAPEPVRVNRSRRDEDDDDENMSEVDTWLR